VPSAPLARWTFLVCQTCLSPPWTGSPPARTWVRASSAEMLTTGGWSVALGAHEGVWGQRIPPPRCLVSSRTPRFARVRLDLVAVVRS
jgi:hypothetical protein